jgi:hypothetical protein
MADQHRVADIVDALHSLLFARLAELDPNNTGQLAELLSLTTRIDAAQERLDALGGPLVSSFGMGGWPARTRGVGAVLA